ncbi:Uncharacterised protein [Enterobacter cloacae]|nr:Uncharacterised protein [Enterobacter cloacae]
MLSTLSPVRLGGGVFHTQRARHIFPHKLQVGFFTGSFHSIGQQIVSDIRVLRLFPRRGQGRLLIQPAPAGRPVRPSERSCAGRSLARDKPRQPAGMCGKRKQGNGISMAHLRDRHPRGSIFLKRVGQPERSLIGKLNQQL